MKDIYMYDKKDWEKKRSKYVLCNPNEKELEDALEFIANLLKILNVEYVFTAGTCLGIYRDNNFIHNDDDIDIDVLSHDYKLNVNKMLDYLKFKEVPFRLGEVYNFPKVSMFYHGVKISIVAQIEEDNKMLTREVYTVPISYLFPAKNLLWKGHAIKIPHYTEKYLRHVYGKNWRTPEQWNECDRYNKEYIRRKHKIKTTTKIINKIKSEVNKFLRYNCGVYYLFLP